MMFLPTNPFVAPELAALEYVLERFFSVMDTAQFTRSIIGFDGDENPAGRLFDVVHRDFDIRKLNFWSLDQSKVRRFSVQLAFNGVKTYGFHTTFFGSRVIGTELFSYDIEIPRKIRTLRMERPSELGEVW